MNNSSHYETIGAWSGIIFIILFAIGWCIIAGFLPPPDPNLTGQEIAKFYQSNTTLVRIGLLTAAFSCTFYYPWVAAIFSKIKQIEGVNPVYT